MRLGTVSVDGANKVVAALGAWDDPAPKLLDLRAADAALSGIEDGPFATMMTLIGASEEALERAASLVEKANGEHVLDSAEVTFLAPIPVPEQMRDCLVFEEHMKNSFAQAEKMTGRSFEIPPVWYEQPIYYKSNRFSVVGHGAEVRWPPYSQMMDFELELGIVIGRGGRDIPSTRAMDHVFGYTIFNDFSARDAQMKEMAGQLGPAKGKDFDTGNVLGPFVLTADEVDHPVDLRMDAYVNGERWGGGRSSAMHHSFADIIAFISSSETIHAGEVIGSGTVGTGCGLEIGRTLSDGDTVELRIEKIGTLRNTIRKPS